MIIIRIVMFMTIALQVGGECSTKLVWCPKRLLMELLLRSGDDDGGGGVDINGDDDDDGGGGGGDMNGDDDDGDINDDAIVSYVQNCS